jgi:ribosomal protein S27E
MLALAVQLPFAIWLVVALARSDTTCPNDQAEEFCQLGRGLGMAATAVLILVVWASVDVILGVCWVVSNDNLRTCPECGRRSKNGWLVCPNCGYEFLAMAARSGRDKPTKTVTPTMTVTPKKNVEPTKNVRCFKCSHLQSVPVSRTEFTCEHCGQRLKRKTG